MVALPSDGNVGVERRVERAERELARGRGSGDALEAEHVANASAREKGSVVQQVVRRHDIEIFQVAFEPAAHFVSGLLG